jgi:hypothetical protein
MRQAKVRSRSRDDRAVQEYSRQSAYSARRTAQRATASDQPPCLVGDDGSIIDSVAAGVQSSGIIANVIGQVLICVGVALITLLASGCDSGDGGASKYTPATDTAHQALEAALGVWKRGEPSGPIAGMPVPVEVADSKRQAGQKLANYEILGEVPGDGQKRFSVRLKLENPSQELETQYVVVGRDPIWVFGQEDYAQSKGM